jgi:hypothetical protein
MNVLKKQIAQELDDLLDFEFEHNLSTLKKTKSYILAKKFTLTFLLIFVGFIFLAPDIKSDSYYNGHMVINAKTLPKKVCSTVLMKMMLAESESYIKRVAPHSRLSADTLVKQCLKYDMDICFVLAQGNLESHFGTRGTAAETNSVFNVGTYDDGTILYKYDDPNASVEPYVKLIRDKYLDDFNNIDSLMHSYKNKSGHRFASSKRYEKILRVVYSKITSTTTIKTLQNIYVCQTSN